MTDPNTTNGIPRRRRRPGTAEAELEDKLSQSVDAAIAGKATPEAALPPGDPAPAKAKRAAAKPAAAPAPEPPPIFTTAPAQTLKVEDLKMPDLRHGFQTVVNDLFADGYDVRAEYQAVVAGLEIKDALSPDRMRRAANEAEKIAERASRLYIVGKVEVAAYIRQTDGIYGAVRDAAITQLEIAKASGSRTKQITDADAKAEAARLYPDQWADICDRRDKAEAMLKQLETLAALARSRCYTVSNMANPNSAKFSS